MRGSTRIYRRKATKIYKAIFLLCLMVCMCNWVTLVGVLINTFYIMEHTRPAKVESTETPLTPQEYMSQ